MKNGLILSLVVLLCCGCSGGGGGGGGGGNTPPPQPQKPTDPGTKTKILQFTVGDDFACVLTEKGVRC